LLSFVEKSKVLLLCHIVKLMINLIIISLKYTSIVINAGCLKLYEFNKDVRLNKSKVHISCQHIDFWQPYSELRLAMEMLTVTSKNVVMLLLRLLNF